MSISSHHTSPTDRPVSALTFAATVIIAAAIAVTATPIPLDDHSYLSFDWSRHYRLDRPAIAEPLDVHNLSLQFSNRYYYTKDTSQVNNRWLVHFADSIVFRDIEFNFRIRIDGLGERVRDAGWTSARAGEENDPGFVYDPDRIVAYYTPNEYFRFGFGKERYNWGPLELGGLMLSDYNEGLTGFYQQYALGGFTLRGVTGQLNSMRLNANDPDKVTYRYFSAARLEYHKPTYGAALGQSIVYAGVNRSLDMRFLFPFYIYHYGQMTDGSENTGGFDNNSYNTAGSIDAYMKIYKLPLEIYGQVFVDDFQGHADEFSSSVQNAVSWMAGLRLKDAGAWYGFIEGGQISTYTYNHIAPQMHYMINRCFLGSPLGPDRQLVWGKFGRIFAIPTGQGADTLSADVNFWLNRKGERGERDGKLFTIPGMAFYQGTRYDDIPYGTVEEELSFWASASYRKFFVDLELKGGMTMYKNRENVKSSDWKTYPFFGVFLTTGISSSARARE